MFGHTDYVPLYGPAPVRYLPYDCPECDGVFWCHKEPFCQGTERRPHAKAAMVAGDERTALESYPRDLVVSW